MCPQFGKFRTVNVRLAASETAVEKNGGNSTKTKNWAAASAADELGDFGQGLNPQFRDKTYEILPCTLTL